ncbi:hypothetical protein JCM8547_006575 [Rhodosporidiobolus lusitaniae]
MSSPLVLPAPPPPPGSTGTVSRAPSAASTFAATSVAAPSYHTALDGQAEEEEEPTVDDLTREVASLSNLVSEIASRCTFISTLRDSTLSLPSSSALPSLQRLSELTTSTGSLILTLSEDIAAAEQRLRVLQRLVEVDKAAALPAEVGRIEESLEVVKSEAAKGVQSVRKLADEEIDARESTRRRLEERVRLENPGLGEEAVESSVRQALVGAEVKVAQLDLQSYAGRVAAESPFTELASLLSRTNTRLSTSTGTTLVDSLYPFSVKGGEQYSKLDAGDDEQHLLAGQRGTLLGGLEGVGGGDVEKGAGGGGKLTAWRKLRLYWRDYLVRIGILIIVVGFIAGICAYEAIAQKNQDDDSSSSTTVAAAAQTVG